MSNTYALLNHLFPDDEAEPEPLLSEVHAPEDWNSLAAMIDAIAESDDAE